MGDIATDVLAEWEKDHPEPDSQPSTPEPAAQSTEAAPPAAQESKSFTLDDVLPDDPRIPESFRGKPLSSLVEDRHQIDIRAKKAGFDKNAAEEKANALKLALEIAARQIPQQPKAAPTRPSDELKARGVQPRVVYEDADRYTDAVAGVARDASVAAVEPKISTLEQRLSELQQELDAEKIRTAFRAAKPEGISDSEWGTQTNINLLSAYVAASGLNPKDPASYRQADEALEKDRPRKSARTVPAAPAPPAPPVGNGKSAPVVSKPAPKLSTHVISALNDVTDVLKGVLGNDITTDKILDGMREDSRYKEMFQ